MPPKKPKKRKPSYMKVVREFKAGKAVRALAWEYYLELYEIEDMIRRAMKRGEK